MLLVASAILTVAGASAAPCELHRDTLVLTVQGRDWDEGIVGAGYGLGGATWLGAYSPRLPYSTWGVYDADGAVLPTPEVVELFGDEQRRERIRNDMRGARTRTWAMVFAGLGLAAIGGFLATTETPDNDLHFTGFGSDLVRNGAGVGVLALSLPVIALSIPQVPVERHREQFPSRYWTRAEIDAAIERWNATCASTR